MKRIETKVILLTGCSSGIGRALSEEFHRRGHRVTATARRRETLEPLKSEGIAVDQLDVTNVDDIERVIDAALAREGHIDVLVNNAGYGLIAPTLDVLEDELLAQFQTNVFAPLSLIRRIAPVMRKYGGGTIVNIGSISGIVTTPFSGAYCASKAALHALSEALRMELAPFGIRVIIVQPGGIESNFGNASGRLAERVLKQDSWYSQMKESILVRARVSQGGAMSSPEFARKLVRIIEAKNPPAVVRLGSRSFLLPFMKGVLPTGILDAVLRKRFGLAKSRFDDINA